MRLAPLVLLLQSADALQIVPQPFTRTGARLGRPRMVDDLAAEFAAEARARQAKAAPEAAAGQEGPFSGIREIVLDEAGKPKAVPRRAPPPPGTTMREEVGGLAATPGFVFGSLLTIGAAGLLLAIAGADSAASSL